MKIECHVALMKSVTSALKILFGKEEGKSSLRQLDECKGTKLRRLKAGG
jgi:hypothetical protein